MTPLEKANELYSKYDDLLNKDFINPIVFDNQLKQCALIAVDEIMMTCAFNNYKTKINFEHCSDYEDCHFFTYWEEVKKEIENL